MEYGPAIKVRGVSQVICFGAGVKSRKIANFLFLRNHIDKLIQPFFFRGCPSADASADGNGGPPGFTIPGTTSSTPWTGVTEDHLYIQ